MAVVSDVVLQKLIDSWKNSRFEELQKETDVAAEEVEKTRKASLEERKDLSLKTKEFKKQTDEVKLVEMKTLLKLYQGGIDSLTKRAKYAESIFFHLYETLGEFPDPYPLLEQAAEIDQIKQELESKEKEEKALREELKQKESLSTEVRSLQQELQKTKNSVGAEIQKRVSKSVEECERKFSEKERLFKDSEQEHAETINQLNKKVRELQATQIDHTLQFGQLEAPTEEAITKSSEYQSLLNELDEANRTVGSLVSENERLKQSSDESKLENDNSDNNLKEHLDFMELRNRSLTAELEQLHQSSQKELETFQNTQLDLEKQLEQKQKTIHNQLETLKSYSDYEEMKRELSVLKQIELSADSQSNESTSLEAQILKREKKLSNELSKLRTQEAHLQQKLVDEKTRSQNLVKDNREQKEALQKLERELASLSAEGSMSYVNNGYRESSGRLSPTSSIIGGSPSVFGGSTMSKVTGTESSSTIMDIVKQQRDRFRRANVDLVNQVSSSNEKIATLESKLREMEKSNALLYEQMRFREQYQNHLQPSPSQIEAATAYENNISPFASFRKKEAERAFSRMGSFERVLYVLLRTILLNNGTRTIFLTYLIILHLFILVVLFKLGVSVNRLYALPEPTLKPE
ncbi:CASP family protein [Schizosaccharomyces cryophilus OY26]|uniref:Protein CASP n=1 Tax=Schizosaccharomyces cryophilus (strain OY26 / ATCC MYA-4695 / CBS 11777 / NBRC 106824 / NRRL Y48691) TaxID=653667 RepID=S9VPT4_SCHCR|nr:CASP family protein [Schizosaccharomyces cryophilus OY26]EPY49953.1 CASP family protein [Schizosaccharomyces cryophilus OY26]